MCPMHRALLVLTHVINPPSYQVDSFPARPTGKFNRINFIFKLQIIGKLVYYWASTKRAINENPIIMNENVIVLLNIK